MTKEVSNMRFRKGPNRMPLTSFTVQNDRIQLSLRCIRSLGYPEYVHIYYSKEPKQLLLVPCKQNEDDAIRITRFGERNNFTINRTHLVKLIKEIACTDENRKYLGEYVKEYGGVLFDLSDSKQIGYSVPLKKTRPLPRAWGHWS